MASASAAVNRLDDPIPSRTPPAVQLPALTMTRLVPADCTCRSTTALAPAPSATIAITAVTPMTRLSIVSAVRRRFFRRAASASPSTIGNSPPPMAYDRAAARVTSGKPATTSPFDIILITKYLVHRFALLLVTLPPGWVAAGSTTAYPLFAGVASSTLWINGTCTRSSQFTGRSPQGSPPMRALVALTFTVLVLSHDAAAADRLCDTAFEDCRAPLLELIRNERVGVDVAFWFMEDARYTAALARKIAEGVPVRVLVDPRANGTYPLNADRLTELRDAGAPMRRRTASGILHWKMMLFEGQNTVQFSAANYTSAFVPNVPYENYIDEVIYFSDDTAVVDSFRTKYDDLWTDDTAYADYANVTRPLVRRYPTVEKDPELNFPPREELPQPRGRALQRRDGSHRRHHVPHHGPRAHGRDDPGDPARRPGPTHHRARTVPRSIPLLALMERRSPLRGRRTDPPPRPCRPDASEVGRVARSGPDDLRLLELDVAVEQLAGRAQLLHGQAGVLPLLHRAVRAEMDQRHRPSRDGAVSAAAARPAGQRRAVCTGRSCRGPR